jgi:hypothetical protein
MIWTDERLTWRPSDYGWITDITLPSDPSISGYGWVPDLYIVEDKGETLMSNLKLNNMKVSYNGTVYYEAQGEFKVAFSPDVYLFPYDT